MVCNFCFSNSVYNKANIFLGLIEYELNSLRGANISVHIRFNLERYLLNSKVQMCVFYYFLWIYNICLYCSKIDIITENNSMH